MVFWSLKPALRAIRGQEPAGPPAMLGLARLVLLAHSALGGYVYQHSTRDITLDISTCEPADTHMWARPSDSAQAALVIDCEINEPVPREPASGGCG